MPASSPLHAAIALVAYAEPFVEGRRVLFCGDALSELPERLLERGARLVHVCDPEPSRVSEAAARNPSRNITFAPLADGALAFRDGVFDLVLVEDVSALANRTAALRRFRRALSPSGAAILVSPNAEVQDRLLPAGPGATALDYYALYDLVSGEFEHVRMLGQAPFVGYAVADFAAQTAEIEPAIDTGFLPGGAEEPEYFIALATERETLLDAFTIVQLPLALTAEPRANAHLEQKLAAAQASERLARDRAAELEAELAARDTKLGHGAAEEHGELERLRQQLERREQWIRQLEERAATADARADQAEEELEELREASVRAEDDARARASTEAGSATELERLRREAGMVLEAQAAAEKRAAEARTALETAEARARAAQEAVEGADGRAAEARAELGEVRAELGRLREAAARWQGEAEAAQAEAHSHREALDEVSRDAAGFEQMLAERAGVIHSLEERLREAGRAGRALLRRLEASPGELGPLLTRLVEQEAELQASRWTTDRLLADLEVALATSEQRASDLELARGGIQQGAVLLEQVANREVAAPAAGEPSAPGGRL